MRTTLTLDPDVAQWLDLEMKRSNEDINTLVNRALRIGLGMSDKSAHPQPFKVVPHDFRFRPRINLDRLNQLVDELEAEETVGKLGR